ncbi:MAG TPA: lysophospholipid acyltransferase family protein [Pyrinomonadaceae bacterium]|nr:lysophospholipid acyltransferase family protein [Pyrinomonadaceae bacterium]
MASNFRVVRLRDLLTSRKGGPVFRLLLFIFGSALQLFFRRIETVNEDVVPEGTGVIFVLNHPNGLIDPALIFVALPRRISFLAKSTLFRMPVISWVVKVAGALPVYRRVDSGEDVSQNMKTFAAAHELLRRGGSLAIFPEGISHNSTKLLPAKTGAARIALGTVSIEAADALELFIVPVGLYYTSKTTFRSEALLHFGKPFRVEPVRLETDGEVPREAVRELTALIEKALSEVTLNAETDAELETADMAHSIFTAEGDAVDLRSRQAFLKAYVARAAARSEADGLSPLEKKVRRFDERLGELGIEPFHLSLARYSRSFVVGQAIMQTWYLILLAPLAIVGTILHTPAYQISKLLSRIYARHGADDVASTVKVLAGILFMPLTWLIVAGVVYYFFDWRWALASLPLSFVTGYAALITLERLAELSRWARAIIKFFSDRDRFLRLLVERREIQSELQELEN